MSDTWYTADHHFGHKNIIKYCNRPFFDADEMDEMLIQKWNSRVKSNDLVYHLGDFTLGNVNIFKSYEDRLNGNIIFIPGQHDWNWFKKQYGGWKNRLVSTKMYYKGERIIIVLCHYPLRSWDGSNYDSIHLHGHSHGNLPRLPRTLDVGVDCHDFYPINLDAVMEMVLDD